MRAKRDWEIVCPDREVLGPGSQDVLRRLARLMSQAKSGCWVARDVGSEDRIAGSIDTCTKEGSLCLCGIRMSHVHNYPQLRNNAGR